MKKITLLIITTCLFTGNVWAAEEQENASMMAAAFNTCASHYSVTGDNKNFELSNSLAFEYFKYSGYSMEKQHPRNVRFYNEMTGSGQDLTMVCNRLISETI